jgi:hypothetical protein
MKTLLLSAIAAATLGLSINAASAVDINGDNAAYRAADLSVIQSKPVAGRSFFSAETFNGDINGDGATYRAADLEVARSGSLTAR